MVGPAKIPRNQGKKKAHKHKLFGPVALGTRECPRDKPGLSPGQSGFVPGTKPRFLLILHSGSPVCPWDKPSCPGDIRGRRAADRVYVLKVYVPFSFPKKSENSPTSFCRLAGRKLNPLVCGLSELSSSFASFS